MTYKIHITKAAERDLTSAADYIEFNLHNPKAADDLLDTAEEKISALSENPQLYAVIDDPVLRVWAVRFIKVNNYLAFYTVSEHDKTVHIVRFLYGKRDWISILRNGTSAISAMHMLQSELQGEAEAAGLTSEEAINALVKEVRNE